MFDSPIKNTLLLLLLFVAICGFGLQKVLHFPESTLSDQSVKVSNSEDYSGWLTIRSAHPFRSTKVLINDIPVTLDSLSSSESEAEISLEKSSLIKVEVAWPEGTPETAVLVSLDLDGAASFEKTFWAQEIPHAEFTPTL